MKPTTQAAKAHVARWSECKTHRPPPAASVGKARPFRSQASTWSPELIFMDLRMPRLNGLQATRRLKALAPGLKIVAVTADAFEEDRAAAVAAGCDDYVRKPVLATDILGCLQRHLGLCCGLAPEGEASGGTAGQPTAASSCQTAIAPTAASSCQTAIAPTSSSGSETAIAPTAASSCQTAIAPTSSSGSETAIAPTAASSCQTATAPTSSSGSETPPVPQSWSREPVARSPAAPAPAHRAAPDTRLQVLLADDSEANRRLLLAFLQRLDLRADAVADGAEAVRAARRKEYGLVFMDLQMPRMDGAAAARAIRSELPAAQQPVIVALTASHEDAQHCLEAGMDCVLRKPFSMEQLRNVLRQAQVGARSRLPSRSLGSLSVSLGVASGLAFSDEER